MKLKRFSWVCYYLVMYLFVLLFEQFKKDSHRVLTDLSLSEKISEELREEEILIIFRLKEPTVLKLTWLAIKRVIQLIFLE